jgi:hypothetical protein
MRWFIILSLACAALLLADAREARADGKLFARSEVVVRIPDQQALIIWRDGEQTLVVETRFEQPAGGEPGTDGADYAWLIPIPGDGAREGFTPRVLEASTGLFPTLRNIFRPRIERESGVPWPLLMGGAAIILAAGLSRARVWPRLLLAIGGLFVVTALFLPALGTSRGVSGTGDLVTVYERSLVGSFDVAVLGASEGADASDASAVRGWLSDNGFRTPPGVDDVMDAYSRDGWLFVAAKVRTDAQTNVTTSGEPLTPHPLAVRFRTASPVYPLRLTGVGNGPLGVDLYVFGPARAGVAGMRIERFDAARVPTKAQLAAEPYPWRYRPDKEIYVGHPGLRSLIEAGADTRRPLYATKLTGTFTPRQMEQDAAITWSDNTAPVGASAYSLRGAIDRGLVAASITLLAGALLCTLLVAVRPGVRRGVAAAWALGIPCVAFIGVLATTPTVEVTTWRDSRPAYIGQREFTDQLYMRLHDTEGPLDLPRALKIAAELRETATEEDGIFPDPGDGPGEWILRRTPDGALEFILHGWHGGEQLMWTLPARPTSPTNGEGQ